MKKTAKAFNKRLSRYIHKWLEISEAKSLDDAAGDFLPGVSCGLCCKIVWVRVDNHCFTENIIYIESVCEEYVKGIPAISPQRQQVSGMIGMPAAVGVIVCSGVCKGISLISGARAAAVNVKSKYPAAAIRFG